MKKLIIFLLLLLFPVALSFNFGVVPKYTLRPVQQGESVQFILLFWNLGNSSYPVSLKLSDNPEGFDIIVRPKDFILNPTPLAKNYPEGEYVDIPGYGIVKAEVLKVFIKVSDIVEPGEYNLRLIATAGQPKEQISVFQEREIYLKVKVEKKTKSKEPIFDSLKLIGSFLKEGPENLKNITGAITKIPIKSLVEDSVKEKIDEIKKSITGLITKPSSKRITIIIGILMVSAFISFLIINRVRKGTNFS